MAVVLDSMQTGLFPGLLIEANSMDEMALWNQVRCCFDQDDGSLPSIAVESLSASEIGLIFEELARNGHVITVEPVVHDRRTDQILPLDNVSNAGSLVGEFAVSPFHLAFGGFVSNGQELPELGVFFFQDSIAIDYRMGSAWDSTKW